jgi:ADP-ribose pyrophosphatase YjhB (NUDIX family)
MEIKDRINYEGKNYHVTYTDADTFRDLPYDKINQHYGVCFFDDKIVVGWNEKKQHWSLIGGKIEPQETVDDTLVREVREESNMKVRWHQPIGYQQVTAEDGSFVYQLRSCCVVEPMGAFVNDPAGHVTKILLIDPEEWDSYIDWGVIGKRILARALEIKSRYFSSAP